MEVSTNIFDTLISSLLDTVSFLDEVYQQSSIGDWEWPSYEDIHFWSLPLHRAAQDRRVGGMKKYLKACPTVAMKLVASRETALQSAISCGQVEAVGFMLEWLKGKSNCRYVIDMKDRAGNTTLQLAVSKKLVQTVKQLLDYGSMLETNAKNYCDLKSSNIFEYSDMDKEIGKFLEEAGALRGRDVVDQKVNVSNHEVLIEVGKEWQQWPSDYAVTSRSLLNRLHVELILVTLLAYCAFYLELTVLPRIENNVYEPSSSGTDTFRGRNQDAVIMFMHLTVLVNSITFFMSLALITILTHELPLKPWVPITVLSAFGAFMSVVMANSHQDFMAVLSIGSFILLAAFAKCLALHKVMIHLLERVWIRVKS